MFRIILLLLVAVTTHAKAVAQLAYRFNVGEELIYEIVEEVDLLEKPEESDRRHEIKARWNVYPIRQNEDGSWHLVIRSWIKVLQFDREKNDTGEFGEWTEEVRLENTFLGYCDLMPDGSYATNSTLGKSYLFELLPELLFMPLPIEEQGEEPAPRTAPNSGTIFTLHTNPIDADGGVRLTGSLERTTSANYELTHELDIDFDANAGRVRQIVETSKSERKGHLSHDRTTYRLVQVVKHPPEWTAKLEVDAEAYFLSHDAWWKHKMQAGKIRTEKACREFVSKARRRIVESQRTIELAEVRSAYDGLIALHDREEEWDIDGAAEREELYAQPPVDWISTNLAGEPRRSADYRGKVVILDFWYRGCVHCVLAMPKVKKLYAKYPNQGLVVLGVNSDTELENALHVVKTYSIPYENVHNVMTSEAANGGKAASDAEESKLDERRISSEYQVDVWPTFIVLDQLGQVVEMVEGNHDDLVEHLSGVVDGLLANPPSE